MTPVTYRTATLAEVGQLLDWAAQEGWNPGIDDAVAFHAADPAGFFVAQTDGQPVAGISVVNHSDSFAFLGLYLCRPAYRGKGIGYGLWAHAMAHAGHRTIGLDGVPAQEENYARSGFVLAGRTRRLVGPIPSEPLTLPLARTQDAEAIAVLDHAANGVTRKRFLREWLRQTANRKTVVVHQAGELVGFATARQCREDCKIGPIVAPDAATALGLAHQAAAALGATTGIIDVPDTCAAFEQRLRRNGFIESFGTARMYRGNPPTTGARLQAVATLELG
ncbi:GNAT family N-acetyltransferase [Tropicibacter oceani]|uniref:GNAT family N-acetyltransferase n=1 Tax=Tropicibacter oceani TaxID=3058420 RepID=A0ABY8QN91_9RHOB|nr:GNAT family N-acetyltransferase [Tropicibacter oceani]WGW05938.1 GNAT family N-acetyltransferase [Tropicibacter oceani]